MLGVKLVTLKNDDAFAESERVASSTGVVPPNTGSTTERAHMPGSLVVATVTEYVVDLAPSLPVTLKSATVCPDDDDVAFAKFNAKLVLPSTPFTIARESAAVALM